MLIPGANIAGRNSLY